MYSPAIDKLIAAFKKLPGVGQHTAERYVFHLLKSGKKEVAELALALQNLFKHTQSCRLCWNFSDENPCALCASPSRSPAQLCVVAEPQDLAVIEKTRAWRGLYFVLRGLIDARDPETLQKLKIKELLARLKPHPKNKLTEVVLALSPTLAGETTMLYLEKEIKKTNPALKTSRLARGLPLGGDVRYADDLTIESAIKNRVTK